MTENCITIAKKTQKLCLSPLRAVKICKNVDSFCLRNQAFHIIPQIKFFICVILFVSKYLFTDFERKNQSYNLVIYATVLHTNFPSIDEEFMVCCISLATAFLLERVGNYLGRHTLPYAIIFACTGSKKFFSV